MTGAADADVSEAVSAAADEIDYQDVEGSFGQTFATSIPCQLRFVETPEQDTERFHAALEERGYSPMDSSADRRAGEQPSSPWYDGEIISEPPYKRFRVLVFRGDCVRIFPKDDFVPSEAELQVVVDAVEVGFKSSVRHDPIDED